MCRIVADSPLLYPPLFRIVAAASAAENQQNGISAEPSAAKTAGYLLFQKRHMIKQWSIVG